MFCRPAPLQAALYRTLLSTPEVRAMIAGADGDASAGSGAAPLPPLVAISLLRRLCTSPGEALRARATADGDGDAGDAGDCEGADSPLARVLAALRRALPPGADPDDVAHSGKLAGACTAGWLRTSACSNV